jgi:hypothetical protein
MLDRGRSSHCSGIDNGIEATAKPARASLSKPGPRRITNRAPPTPRFPVP